MSTVVTADLRTVSAVGENTINGGEAGSRIDDLSPTQ